MDTSIERRTQVSNRTVRGGTARRRDKTQKTYCWSRLSHTFLDHNFIRDLVCLALNVVASIHLTLVAEIVDNRKCHASRPDALAAKLRLDSEHGCSNIYAKLADLKNM